MLQSPALYGTVMRHVALLMLQSPAPASFLRYQHHRGQHQQQYLRLHKSQQTNLLWLLLQSTTFTHIVMRHRMLLLLQSTAKEDATR